MDVIGIGETMVLFTPENRGLMRHAKTFTQKVAGAETNTLIGLARLGHQVGWISRLGCDEFGNIIDNFVRGEGIDTKDVVRDPNHPTAVFFKEIITPSYLNIYYYRKFSAASHLEPADLRESYIASAKYLYITGITPALSSSAQESLFHAVKLAKQNHVQIVFDPNLRRKLWSEEEAKETLIELAKQSDIVLPGLSEGHFLFNTKDEIKIAEEFLKMGADKVIVKLGEKGAYYISKKEGSGWVEGFPVKVIDPVGAGDGFASGLLSGLLSGLDLRDSVIKACAVGAFVTTIEGDSEGLPTKEMLQFFMDQKNEDIVR